MRIIYTRIYVYVYDGGVVDRYIETGGCSSRDCELVRVALSLVLKDEGFALPSTPASNARDSADKLLEYSSQLDCSRDREARDQRENVCGRASML